MQTSLHDLQTATKIRIEHAFQRYISDRGDSDLSSTALFKAVEYSLFNGGKRVRPLLISLVCEMLGAQEQDADTISLAIECIHAYSLVHDDLPAMDDDTLRRGKPTCHIKFDEATAILAGDALQTLAFEILSDAKLSEFANARRIMLVKELALASGLRGMCQGQSLDLQSTKKDISFESLKTLHTLKTGALLRASVRLAVLVCPNSNKDELATLSTFADNIGLAFQIQDDILDVVSDTETLGKPQGSDQDMEKNTFVSKLGLAGARKELAHHHHLALQALDRLPYNTDGLREFTDYMVTRTF
ncbi:(2E,6E)-farnesyl diphosphate synthase [Ningiella sp. W23]|uniref:(2E,6E)-farnesyl diphosphate synthase n=1 Tax=Ningiella sp. W23 TaxID=3023715 RepID=UPI0037574642